MTEKELNAELTRAVKTYMKVREFMINQRIHHSETIYQSDRVILNAYEFIDALFKIVKESLPPEKD